MEDNAGRPYAKLDDTKTGTILIADAGFTCIPENSERVVQQDESGSLFIECKEGKHYLAGHRECEGNRTYYVGLYDKHNLKVEQ